MRNLIKGALAVLCLGLFATSLQAQAIRWTLDGVEFEDGGTARGFVDYDASSQMVLGWDITVEGGSHQSFPAFCYTPDNSVGFFYGIESGFFSFQNEPYAGRELRIETVGEVTSEGGRLELRVGLENGSVECYNCAPYRLVSGGAIVGAPRGGYTYHVPVFGAITGGAGSQWNSTLQLINLSSSDSMVTIRYYASGTGAASDTAILLNGRETVTLDDLMTTLSVEGIGSLRIETPTPVAGVARIYSIDASGGTVGQSFALIADDDLMTRDQAGLTALSGDTSQFRSNIGWYQVEAGEIEITFRNENGGHVSSIKRSFGDHTYSQASASSWLGSTVEDGMRITVRVIEGSGTGFVSDVDNKTNDPTTKPLIVIPGLQQ